MRSPIDIRADLDRLAERRTLLWRELAIGHDASKTDECRHLSTAIESLWDELRATSAYARFGPRERLIERARAEARLDEELNRRITGRARGRTRALA